MRCSPQQPGAASGLQNGTDDFSTGQTFDCHSFAGVNTQYASGSRFEIVLPSGMHHGITPLATLIIPKQTFGRDAKEERFLNNYVYEYSDGRSPPLDAGTDQFFL